MLFSGRLRVTLLADLCGLTAKLAQVVELGAANVTTANELDVVDDRRVDGELTLDAHLEGNLTDCEGFTDSVTATSDDDTLEDLDTASATFDDVYVNLDGVADSEVGDVALQRRCVNGIKLLHDDSLSALASGRLRGCSVAMFHLAAPPKQRTRESRRASGTKNNLATSAPALPIRLVRLSPLKEYCRD